MINTVKRNVIVEPAEMVEKNGLFLPVGNENIIQGKVIARGAEADEVSVGSTVVLNKNLATEIDVTGKKYLVTTDEKILAILG